MAQVEIVNFSCFYGTGAKTQHSDKIWGNLIVNNTMVSFWGKRNGRLSFKLRAGAQGRRDAQAKWEEKIGGRKSGDVYTPITSPSVQKMLCPNLLDDVASNFYSKLSKGQVKAS